MEPEHPGNIGAIARTLGNFNLPNLYLVDPKIDHLCDEAIARSKHAKGILKDAKVITKKELKNFDLLIATSAKTGNDQNLNRLPLYPEETTQKILEAENSNPNQKIGILFGREGKGLFNDELEACDLFVKIPAHDSYPVLNLSHACNIICYEIFKQKLTNQDSKSNQKQTLENYEMPSREEKDSLIEKIDLTLEKLDFLNEEKKVTQAKFWNKFISKSFMNKSELYILFGFFKKINRILK